MIDFKHYLRIFRHSLVQVVRSYPVELALAFYAAVLGIVCYELDSATVRAAALMPKLALVPLFFVSALVVNRAAGEGPWRKLYWVVWTPMVPLSLWPGLAAWTDSEQFFITACVLAPQALLLSRRAARNERFVTDGMLWLRSLLLAELFANVALGLFAAILYSTTYIFGLRGGWIDDTMVYAYILCEALAAPVLFLMMAERWRDAAITGNRILAVLLDYIVAPALLIYTAILYLYAAKILVSWSLPEGGVAYLVFGFTLVALCVKALQLVLEQRRYDWFFERFSLVSLPLLVLFWVGVARRVGEYGFTEPRVWLVLCGGVMTLCVALFLFPRSARYRWVCAAAFLIFALSAYVPALAPRRIAVRSQLSRALQVARQLDLLDGDGALILDRFGADTTLRADYRRFYEATEYVAGRDTVAFKRFGVRMKDITGAVSPALYDYVVYGWSDYVDTVEIETVEEAVSWSVDAPLGLRTADIGAYSSLYTRWESWPSEGSPRYELTDSALRLYFGSQHPDIVIPVGQLLSGMLRQAGLNSEAVPDKDAVCRAGERMLVYRDPEVAVVFSRVRFEQPDSGLRIAEVDIAAVLVR